MTTDEEVARLRAELQTLKSAINVEAAMRASKLRARIADLELQISRARSELYSLSAQTAIAPKALEQAVQYDTAVSDLVKALYDARGDLTDSNVLLHMQIVRECRRRLGLDADEASP